MRFEENSHCTFEERIELVAKEIKDVYPSIKLEDAYKIAALDEPINKKADNDNKFIRYYYMLMILLEDLEINYTIYEEMVKLDNLGLNDDKLSYLMGEINKYMLGQRDYPLISEIYGY